MTKNVYLAPGSRTPFGAFMGAFTESPATGLGAAAIRAAISRAKVQPKDVDEVILGNVLSAGSGQNVARQAALGAGLPNSCGATTINKMCGSAMRAIRMAAQAIQCGDADLILAGGTENMTRAPYLLPKGRGGYRMGNGEVLDSLLHDGLVDAYQKLHMGQCAELCARKYEITRQDQDAYAIESYRRTLAAQSEGVFKEELTAVHVGAGKRAVVVEQDEEPAKFNEEKLLALSPAFDKKEGTITAGNASSISDGAAAIVVVGEDKARTLGIPRAAKILGYASVAVEPEWFTIAPIQAIRRLCMKLSLRTTDVDVFEINEAFSVVVLAAMKELHLSHEKVNVLGGAIALGHPIGASGARITLSLMNALKLRKGRIGIATACIGGGEAGAIAIERFES